MENKKRKLKIVVVSTLWERTPPHLYGGTERVCSYITEELVKRGHDVTLFATGDSKTSAKLISSYPHALYRDKVPWTSFYDNLVSCANAMEYAEDIRADIVHSHTPAYSLPFSHILNVPMVVTLHGNIGADDLSLDRKRMFLAFKKTNFVSISNSQRKIEDLNYVATVYNGIPVKSYDFDRRGGDYLVWLGRITPKKGALEAIMVAKATEKKLFLLGKLDWAVEEDLKYFEKEIKPHLRKGKIEYLGEVDHAVKNRYLKGAKALLNPISWNEPFGLVPVEANACGTPAVVFSRGSMPELIDNKINGFLIKPGDIKGMIEFVRKIYQMPSAEYQKMRLACRKHVEENFTIEKMVDGYEEVYRKVIEDFKK